jgi:hypothetical protein
MKFREHRGGIVDSMMTEVEIEPTRDALLAVLSDKRWLGIREVLKRESLRVEPYIYDERIDWDTHIVSVDGYGVVGFTDGPVE